MHIDRLVVNNVERERESDHFYEVLHIVSMMSVIPVRVKSCGIIFNLMALLISLLTLCCCY